MEDISISNKNKNYLAVHSELTEKNPMNETHRSTDSELIHISEKADWVSNRTITKPKRGAFF